MADYRPRSPDLSSLLNPVEPQSHHHQPHHQPQPHPQAPTPLSAAPDFGANATESFNTQNFHHAHAHSHSHSHSYSQSSISNLPPPQQPQHYRHLSNPDSRPPHLPSISTEHSQSSEYHTPRPRQASEYGYGSISATSPAYHSPHSPQPIKSEHQDWPPPLPHQSSYIPPPASAVSDLPGHRSSFAEPSHSMGAPYGLRSRDPAPAQQQQSSYEPPPPQLKRESSPYAPPPPLNESYQPPPPPAAHFEDEKPQMDDMSGAYVPPLAGGEEAEVKSRHPKNLPDPSPVRTRFPTARIKRIMQADEEVGKVAQQTPIAVGKALELFMVQLVLNSADIARAKGSKRVTAPMLKQVVEEDDQWDFLRDIVAKVEEGKKGKESESDEEEVKKKGKGGRKKKAAA